jgi:hypothetical protein
MRGLLRMALGVCSLAAVALIGTQAEAKCARTSAAGFGIAKELAMEMAKMNLEIAISTAGQKARGKVGYKCTGPMLLSECTASQRACS